MEYLSKTYKLDEEVVRSIEGAKAGGTSPNKFLRLLMGLDNGVAPKPLIAHGPPVDVIPPGGGAIGTILVDAEEKSATANVQVDHRPKNCRCRHCGKAFAGPRFSQICGECKSSGHTLSPAECPVCNEASAL